MVVGSSQLVKNETKLQVTKSVDNSSGHQNQGLWWQTLSERLTFLGK